MSLGLKMGGAGEPHPRLLSLLRCLLRCSVISPGLRMKGEPGECGECGEPRPGGGNPGPISQG